jgi:2-polyprenyl-6-methoxyphenol hydroxylase-like FAD-dependent oxidoreductase
VLNKHLVIIGAGMAGASTCINLRANGYEGKFVLVGEEKLLQVRLGHCINCTPSQFNLYRKSFT